MRNAVMLLLAAAMLVSCTREDPKPPRPPFDKAQFLTRGLQTLLSDIDLGAMAAKKGRVAETRAFGQAFERDMREMQSALTAVARRKNVAIPTTVEEKKVALKDNLTILPGQVFDRGYLLAMLQDIRWFEAQFARASEDPADADLVAFGRRWGPVLDRHEKEAERVLEKLGGSPFGFVPP